MAARRVRWDRVERPAIVTALVAVNLVVYVLVSGGRVVGGGSGRDLLGTLGLFGPAVAAGDWYRLVTSGFIHFGLIHLGFNMLALYRFGGAFEADYGPMAFVGLFSASLLAGSAGALLASPSALSGGASGAVFGIIGASALMLRRRGLGVWQSEVGGLLLINLLFTFVIPGISVGGHIGGLVGGLVVAAATPEAPLSKVAVSRVIAVAAAVSVVSIAVALLVAGQ